MQAIDLLAPGVGLAHAFLHAVVPPQPTLPPVQTPTSSADEADAGSKGMLKDSITNHGSQVSVALPSDSEHSAAGLPAVHSPAAVDQPPPPTTTTLTATTAATTATTLTALTATTAATVATAGQPATAASRRSMGGGGAASSSGPEPWLLGLFTVSLFDAHGCRCHPGTMRNGSLKRNENNQYCLDCTHVHGTGMCKLCLPGHSAACHGRVFQIRKYMYQTCVHVDDIQPLYDVSGVQAYCINSRRAVLIHPKNVDKDQKCPAFDHTCCGCHRPLRHDCTYCSLRCKVDVEFGFAPITPKGSAAAAAAAARDAGGVAGGAAAAAAVTAVVAAATAAAAAAAVAATVQRQVQPQAQPQPQPPTSRPTAAAKRAASTAATASMAAAAAAAMAAVAALDVSHATRCSSDWGRSGSGSACWVRCKRRKQERPQRSHMG